MNNDADKIFEKYLKESHKALLAQSEGMRLILAYLKQIDKRLEQLEKKK